MIIRQNDRAWREFKMTQCENRKIAQLRQRGALLLDAILALAVIGSVLVTILIIVDQEGKRQEDTIMASSLRNLITGSQEFLGQNYDALRVELADAAASRPDDLAILAIDMQRLANDGYIGNVVLDGGTVVNRYGQEFTLLLRGVDATDGGFPTPTMLNSEITDPIEGDMEIESILVSHGGDPIPGQRGGPIIAKTGLFNAGFMINDFEARGPLGSFAFTIGNAGDTGPYDVFPQYPEEGRFASLISLTNIGVLGFRSDGGDGIDDAFRRCADVDRGAYPDEYDECVDTTGGQLVYSDIVLNVRTESGVSVPPAIRNLSNITCEDDMVRNSDTNRIVVDCSTTEFSGEVEVGDFNISNNELSVGGNRTISFDGADVTIEGDNVITRGIEGEAGELLLDGNPDQNFYDLVFNYERVAAGETVPVPTGCTNPEVFLSVESVADKYGRPIAGYRAVAVPDNESSPTEWDVRLFSFSTDNFCTSTNSSSGDLELNPIQIEPASTGDPAVFDYLRVFINGSEFGFPVLIGGQNPGVQCVEFVDEFNNPLTQGGGYDEIFVLDAFGNPLNDPDPDIRASDIEARIDDVTDAYVDIYEVPPAYGFVNMQIRCNG